LPCGASTLLFLLRRFLLPVLLLLCRERSGLAFLARFLLVLLLSVLFGHFPFLRSPVPSVVWVLFSLLSPVLLLGLCLRPVLALCFGFSLPGVLLSCLGSAWLFPVQRIPCLVSGAFTFLFALNLSIFFWPALAGSLPSSLVWFSLFPCPVVLSCPPLLSLVSPVPVPCPPPSAGSLPSSPVRWLRLAVALLLAALLAWML